MPPFELMYCKPKQPQLFETLEKANTGLRNLQNYIPVYHRFFLLSDSNHNSIGFNHRYRATSVTASETSKNIVIARLDSESEIVSKTPVFIKYSPLLDPIKYLSGKYDINAPDLLALPQYEHHAMDPTTMPVYQKKMHDVNNSSYVDSFFTYLTSQVLHTHGFVHGLDFYGSYLANQDEFTVNVYDDLEYFSTCDFFLKNKDTRFRMDELPSEFFKSTHSNESSRKKPNLKLGDGECADLDLELEDLNSNKETFNEVFETPETPPCQTIHVSELETIEALESLDSLRSLDDEIDDPTDTASKKSDSNSDDSDSCSSRSSASSDEPLHEVTDHNDADKDNSSCGSDCKDCSGSDECDDDDSDCSGSGSDYEDDEVHNAHIFKFPVHAILMEKCDNTLDSLMYGKNELTEAEWSAALMQVIMSLIAYQHMFAFTHNDLHTNNIMFVKTEKKFLHYLYNGVYYRVPTHGRIMKIIDFGRAIYKYRGQTMCSDSYDRTGDAASQYNCEPYMNPKKPRLDPNPSFDLCRLACSLFDYFVEDIRDDAEYAATLKNNRVANVVVEWLKDDKGRNVLYKKNGDERYPDFKLYKMIARTVHGAVPHEQLARPMFSHYTIQRKQINGKPFIMNINALPCYCAGAV